MIFPERFTLKKYKQIEEDDRFTFLSQYMNSPQEAGMAELISYKTKDAEMEWDELRKEWYIYFKDEAGKGMYFNSRYPSLNSTSSKPVIRQGRRREYPPEPREVL